MSSRTLVAGFGNVLRGDDAFGVRVVQELERQDLGPGVVLLEVGTGGIGLVQALFDGYDRLVVVDAMARDDAVGALSVHRVETVDEATMVDLHLATPSQALPLARSLDVLPGEVYLVGCTAGDVDELTMRLSPAVAAAVPRAAAEIRAILAGAADPVRSEARS